MRRGIRLTPEQRAHVVEQVLLRLNSEKGGWVKMSPPLYDAVCTRKGPNKFIISKITFKKILDVLTFQSKQIESKMGLDLKVEMVPGNWHEQALYYRLRARTD